jgi:hypothetical protein
MLKYFGMYWLSTRQNGWSNNLYFHPTYFCHLPALIPYPQLKKHTSTKTGNQRLLRSVKPVRGEIRHYYVFMTLLIMMRLKRNGWWCNTLFFGNFISYPKWMRTGVLALRRESCRTIQAHKRVNTWWW